MSESRFSAVLLETAAFLDTAATYFWAEKLRQAEARISSDHDAARAASEVKSLFGGMGSFNDLFLCEENRNLPPGLSVAEANERLGQLREQCFREANLVGAQ